MKIICIIPARSGSTRLKNKNILLLKKRPLIYWTAKKAIESNIFDKIYLSSNNKLYFEILIKYLKKDNLRTDILEFDERESKHSKTKSKIFDYIKSDFIKKFQFKKNDLIVQLLPTSPLRKIKTIKNAVNLAIKSKKNVFTINEYDFYLSFGLELKNNKKDWKPFYKKSPLITGKTQSQGQTKFYHPNGVAYCLWVRNLNSKCKSIYENAHVLVNERFESFDIDTKDDLNFIKKII